MKTFLLQTKSGETINMVKSIDIEHALTYFSKTKKITKEKIKEIYQIVEQ
jgi:hypothetical protein